MQQDIFQIALVVKDYDEAINYYTQVLNFVLVEDSQLSASKRWVRIRPQGSKGFCLLLAKAKNKEEERSIGNQTGGRVFLFMHTENIARDYLNLSKHGVEIVRNISEESFGKVLVFKDLYGNLWDLIERNNEN
ncbi:MAG: VOC family protein [Chitinophagales bacterium]|nr:VOC family protein [Bacteroidota bacterium]MCB9256380.1 VOC family protein [Chitinophagales bacterium]